MRLSPRLGSGFPPLVLYPQGLFIFSDEVTHHACEILKGVLFCIHQSGFDCGLRRGEVVNFFLFLFKEQYRIASTRWDFGGGLQRNFNKLFFFLNNIIQHDK
jgi:hypothetical protein